MKQYITNKQWQELTDNQAINLIKNIDYDDEVGLGIGQMIEFLGDDFNELHKEVYINVEENEKWCVSQGWDGYGGYDEPTYGNCLCDALFEVVKKKLNEKNNPTTTRSP